MITFLAHPLGPDGPERDANIARALRWLRYLIDVLPEHAFAAPWLSYAQVLDESPANRARGIRDGLAMLATCGAIVLVGGRMSPGMVGELDQARRLGLSVIDLLELGIEPPDVAARLGIERS